MASNLWLYGNSATDLAPQQQSWAGFYQGAAERDRAAAARAAEINSNLILQQRQADEAAMVRDQGRNINLWRYGVGDAAADRADVENTRRFDVGTKLDAQRIAAYGGARNEAKAERANAELKAVEAADNWATFRLPTAATAGENITKSQAAISEAERNFTTQRSALQREMPPGVALNSKGTAFVASSVMPLSPADKPKVDAANEKLADLTAGLQEAQNNLKFHTQTFDEMRKEAQGYGLTVDLQGGRGVIFNPFNKKTYAAPSPVVAPPVAAPAAFVRPPPTSLPDNVRMAKSEMEAALAANEPAPYSKWTSGKWDRDREARRGAALDKYLTTFNDFRGGRTAPTDLSRFAPATLPPIPSGVPIAKLKTARANQLAVEHPEWSRDQIISQVNAEFTR